MSKESKFGNLGLAVNYDIRLSLSYKWVRLGAH